MGGIAGIIGGAANATFDRVESSDPKAIGFAVGAAVVNAVVAVKAHRSVDHAGSHEHTVCGHDHEHNHRQGAHSHTKLHAVMDAGTGFGYAGALAAEHLVPGIANGAVASIGGISAYIGMRMRREINT